MISLAARGSHFTSRHHVAVSGVPYLVYVDRDSGNLVNPFMRVTN